MGKVAFSACWQYMIWRCRNILSLKKPPKKIDEIYMFYNLLLLKSYEINCKTYKFHPFSRQNFQGQNVLILPDQNVSIRFASNIYSENIGTVWDKKLCTKTWYNSKAFVNFFDFSCVIFWVQNFLIPPNHILLLVFHRFFSLTTVNQYFNNVSIYF